MKTERTQHHTHRSGYRYGDGYGFGHSARRGFGLATVLAAALAVTGCGQAPAAPPPPPASSAAPASGAEPAPQDQLVEVVVSGGFAGISHRLVVRYDGSYTRTRGTKEPTSGRMDPAGTAALRAALEDPAYARVPERPATAPTVADGFTYQVTYGQRVVVTQDGTPRPPALQRVLDALPEDAPPARP
ncbi:hypothetical protein ACFVQ4_17935 [Streptomyces laurentii]|uniref:hypothetical protein n=1 Tax=Streptomyces laurentii TaxID=39478 RepID=UPI0036973E2C